MKKSDLEDEYSHAAADAAKARQAQKQAQALDEQKPLTQEQLDREAIKLAAVLGAKKKKVKGAKQ